MTQSKGNRWIIYVAGLLVLALGLTMNTKTGLGVSPILSVSFSAAYIWGWNLGDATFVTYILFVAAQFALRGRERQWKDLLQLPLSLVFSQVLNLFDRLVAYDPARHRVPGNLIFLLAAILVTGLGITMTVNMQLVPNPGDGIVQALAQRMGWEQGFAKNVFDLCCVGVTAVMCLVMLGKIVGIGVGSLIAMMGVGRAVSLVNHFFKDKMCAAAGLPSQGAPAGGNS